MDLGGNTTRSKNNCTTIARESIKGNNKAMSHLYCNYQKYAGTIPTSAQAVFVIRTRHIWHDWTVINKMLDPSRDVYIPQGLHQRDVRNFTLPVSRDISPRGRDYLCEYLQDEYRVYFALLERAVNMNATDIQKAHVEAKKNCPNVDFELLEGSRRLVNESIVTRI